VLAVALVAALLGAVLPAASASAAPRVSVVVADRPGLANVADDTYLTEVRVSGSGFQSIRNGFGGIYVLFGWVDGGWRPSQGGTTGTDYRYVYDDESNPVGYQLFVAFPGSSTEYAANGGTIAENGTWSATMKIPGPRFQAYDRTGAISQVDCTQQQCGIITIGAHGVVNANNESFTPISFQSIYTASDGHSVASSTGSSGPVAVAPSAIGGRPATIPALRGDDELTDAAAGGVEVAAGATRLTVTVPGAQPDAWLGVTLYSDPAFVGWYSPNSEGEIDVSVPETLADGAHRVVVVDAEDTLLGWAAFDWEAPAPDTPSPSAAPQAAPEPEQGLDGLAVAAIAVGGVAVLAVVALVIVLLRLRRRPAAVSPDLPDSKETDR